MHQFNSVFISHPDKGGLIGARNPVTEKVIISDIILRYIATL